MCGLAVTDRRGPLRSLVASPFTTANKPHTIACAAKKSSTASTSQQQQEEPLPATAKAAVETGLARFQSGDSEGALKLFLRAMDLSPTDDEARAALYNAACAYTKLQRWQDACDAIVRVVNDYNLKLVVALRDPDLEALRERREWNAALEKAAGGITNEAYIKLRAEAKSPFRLIRIILFGGLSAGAGLGLIIITTRLFAALQGGEGAPDIQETLQNFAINAAALSVLGFLLVRDVQAGKRDQKVVAREESLAVLQVQVGPNRVLPLAAFRGTTRPVIITGNRTQVNRAIKEAEPFKAELRARGVSLVPIILSEDDAGERLRRLRAELAAESSSGNSGTQGTAAEQRNGDAPQGFGGNTSSSSSSSGGSTKQPKAENADRRWQLEAFELLEWEAWVREQAREAGASNAQLNYYVQVQLDGTVRASGLGIPPWRKFLDDLPEMDDVRTKFTDGRAAG